MQALRMLATSWPRYVRQVLDAGPVALVVPVTAPDPAGTGHDNDEYVDPNWDFPIVRSDKTRVFSFGALKVENAALRAELEHARPVVQAARELLAYIAKHPIEAEQYFTFESKLEVLLSILAARVAALPDTTETEES